MRACTSNYIYIFSFLIRISFFRWEKSSKVAILQSRMITSALRSNLHQISCLLMRTDDFDLANDIAVLLDLLSTPEKDHILNVELMLRLTRALIHYFFLCIVQTGKLDIPIRAIPRITHTRNNYYLCSPDIIKKERGMKVVCHLLRDLTCYSPCARVLALREILVNSINNGQSKYFGAKEKFEPHFEEMLLLHQNHKQVYID